MRALATDPLRNFKFIVTIAGPSGASVPSNIANMGFMTVDGLGIQNEVIPYREGGDNTTTRKMPGQTDFGPITLGHGMLAAPMGGTANPGALNLWVGMVFQALEGQGTALATDNFRSDVTIDILEHPLVNSTNGAGVVTARPIKVRFYIYNAWPMALTWSALDAGGNAVMIETLQLAHEGFVVIYGNTTAGSFLSGSQLIP